MQKTDFIITRNFFETAYNGGDSETVAALGNITIRKSYVKVPITERSLRELVSVAESLTDYAGQGIAPATAAYARDVFERATELLEGLEPTDTPATVDEHHTITPDDVCVPSAHVKAALSGQGRGFYDHIIRAVVQADSRNLQRLRIAYPHITRAVLEAYGRTE